MLLAIAIRVVGAFWFYSLMVTQQTAFHFAWMEANPSLLPAGWRWLFLFNGGDSFQFPLIAMKGYAYPVYVFLPAYPMFIWVVGSLIENYWFGAFIVTQSFALAAIVVFQLLAQLYMDPLEAAYATLLMATFPYISVFTTLGYSEGVFLFASIAAWYLYRRDRLVFSALLAGLTSVSRIYGFAIVVPVFLDIVRKKCWRRLAYLAIPTTFVLAWEMFCYATTGDFLASLTDEKKFYAVTGSNLGLGPTILSQLTHGIPTAGLDPAIIASVALFAFLTVMVWKVDVRLWAYTMIVFIVLLLTVPSHISLLRFLAFLFPLWLTVKIRSPIAVAICLAIFIPMALLMWLYTITVFFVG